MHTQVHTHTHTNTHTAKLNHRIHTSSTTSPHKYIRMCVCYTLWQFILYDCYHLYRWRELVSLVTTKKQQLHTAFGIQNYSQDVKETMVCVCTVRMFTVILFYFNTICINTVIYSTYITHTYICTCTHACIQCVWKCVVGWYIFHAYCCCRHW